MTRTCRLWNLATLLVLLGSTPARAECPVAAWTEQGPTVCGVMIGNRAYLPGLTLTADLALYVGESEEPAEYALCLQDRHGVVCQGVEPARRMVR